MTPAQIAAAIEAELIRQADLFPGRTCRDDIGDPLKVAVLVEEVGEVARAVLDDAFVDELRAELVQVAAVAIAWLEGL